MSRKLWTPIVVILVMVGTFVLLGFQQWPPIYPVYWRLTDLRDVNAPSPSDGQVLKWVDASSEWQAGTDAGGVDTSGTPEDNDFAKFTDADTIEGRSYSEVKADLGLSTSSDVQFADIYHTDFLGCDLVDNGNSGSSKTIDWGTGSLQKITLTAAGVDITFTEPPHPGRCTLLIYQDEVGSRTIDWEHEVSPKWPGGVEPTLTTTADALDIIVFLYIGGGTYIGLFNGDLR